MPPVKVWFNLHRRDWSVKRGTAPVQHYAAFRLVAASFVVSEGARQKVLATRCRSVHAYATGIEAEVIEAAGVHVSYNPYRGGAFYRKDTGADVHTADALHFLPDGRVLAINPR